MTGSVLLTGATGFVGRQILQALQMAGIRVRVVIRTGSQTRLPAHISTIEKIIQSPDLFSECSEWWAENCKGVDTVIHSAWYAEPGQYLQSEKNIDCLAGTLQLAKGAAKAGCKRFIGIGTCFEYDLTSGTVSVETKLYPLTPYAGAKAAAFMALTQWLPLQRVEFAWCRLFYLYGEGEDARRLVPYLRARLEKGASAELTSGIQIRDFMDVAQAGRMVVDVALSNQQGPINICSGIPITIRQLAENIADEYGRRDLLRFGVRPDNLVDPPCVVGVCNKRTT